LRFARFLVIVLLRPVDEATARMTIYTNYLRMSQARQGFAAAGGVNTGARHLHPAATGINV
jgi:hypothetical protein